MYKIEKEIKKGKLTRYEDIELPDLFCPCCSKKLVYGEENSAGQKIMKFGCSDCELTFTGLEDPYRYLDFEDFYNFVKNRLEIKNATSNV